MPIRSLNALRVFDVVASLMSFSAAAERLRMSQGAVSYRIKQLESELGVSLFHRAGSSITLTEAGEEFKRTTRQVLGELDHAAQSLRRRAMPQVVVGVSTYFGSRWLSPRLSRFLTKHPEVILRLQPTIGDSALASADVDVAVVWGSHDRFRSHYQLLLESKVTPMTGPKLAKTIAARGMRGGLNGIPLIHDDETREAWRRWLSAAGLTDRGSRPGPIVPDANMRVQAIIDEQGIALFDGLVSNELDRGLLVAPSDVFLGGFGYYLAVAERRTDRREVEALLRWLIEEASPTAPAV
jgi:LysR family glycine cleavage system transcriptional activator